jgi:hypothetical protein
VAERLPQLIATMAVDAMDYKRITAARDRIAQMLRDGRGGGEMGTARLG